MLTVVHTESWLGCSYVIIGLNVCLFTAQIVCYLEKQARLWAYKPDMSGLEGRYPNFFAEMNILVWQMRCPICLELFLSGRIAFFAACS